MLSVCSPTVPTLIFTTMYRYRDAIHKLGTELHRHNQSRGSVMTVNQFAKSKQARNSFASLSVEMLWLLPKFEKFRPSAWWAGVGMLVLRLFQTSLMALVRTQLEQATIVSCVTLISISLLRELSPMRVASDNQVAVLAQALVFCWTFVLLLRIAGMFQEEGPAAAVGALLCFATFAVFVAALGLANADRVQDQRAERSDSSTTINDNDETEVDETQAPQGSAELEAGPLQGCALPRQEEAEVEEAVPSSLTWPMRLLGNSSALCGAEAAEDDDAGPVTTGETDIDELARLAIAAGAKRSQVSRLALSLSSKISPTTPPRHGDDAPTDVPTAPR